MKKPKLSVVMATFNEESNLARCLESVKAIADEIVIVDGESTDKTVGIAKKFKATISKILFGLCHTVYPKVEDVIIANVDNKFVLFEH